MPTDQSFRTGLTRRSIVSTVGTISLAARIPAEPASVRADCRAWLQADDRLETLTLEWSEAEAELMAAGVQLAHGKTTPEIRRLERHIARTDQERSSLLDRIVAVPAAGPKEVVGKLLVARRLLEGEGGAEHDLVADVVMRLATIFGLGE